jgi:antitoxin component YwqK of YwqJK toxin-antitoxin module
LSYFGEYRKGKPVGSWYYFDEQSRLSMIESKIQKNTTMKLKHESGKMVILPWRSYLVKYYPNGYVREEGLVVYEDDIEIDNLKIGVWNYYDESGKLIRTKKENGARGD